MKTNPVRELEGVDSDLNDGQIIEPVGYDFGLRRRTFVQLLSAGLLIISAAPSLAQSRPGGGGRGGGSSVRNIGARILLGKDGGITVLTGKVECGQGSRGELTQAAAEELRVAPDRIQMVMADTDSVPDDGMTVGSRTTPSTVPAVRQGAAAARDLLVEFAAKKWNVEPSAVSVRDGKAVHADGNRTLSYTELANDVEAMKMFERPIPSDAATTAHGDWKVLGTSLPRPNGRDIVTGVHQYPSDIRRPGMLYGKVLRPPAFGAKLASIDLEPAKAMKGVVAARDDQFVGVAASTTFLAEQAIAALGDAATWERVSHPSSKELFEHLRKTAQGGIPENPFAGEDAKAKSLRAEYNVAYVQHVPLEPRAAVAEWTDGRLTVWTATQRPQGVRTELARAFHVGEDRVRVIVPDFGGGFGGKHTGEAAIEAARIALAAGKPVSLRWTREEEFTWAVFRPAALISVEAALNDQGAVASWFFVNVNAGGAGIETPYRIPRNRSRSVGADAPLRHGSYRALAATANNFARESFMDELASASGADPLQFRLAHLENPRLRAVLEEAARRFNWTERSKKKSSNTGVGLACGTEKGSFVAACAEIEISGRNIRVRHVCEVFECGAVLNPENTRAQVEGAIIQGLGPALTEEVQFDGGIVRTVSFGSYTVPRFEDVPSIDIHLLNRPDLASVGSGETPIIAIAPAIANAVFHATGKRIRSMPIRL